MTSLEIAVFQRTDVLARSVAARTLAALEQQLTETDLAHMCLTGGRGGAAALAAVRDAPRRDAVDWSRVHVWWSDERYLPAGDPDRNDTLARTALLEHLRLPADHIHAMPDTDRFADPSEGARWYADELAAFGTPGPAFSVSLLGVGEDGHVASLFPGHPALRDQRAVFAVGNAPKPPPVRISMGWTTINLAREVILIATGARKARAVGLLINDAGPWALPAAGVHGRTQTLLAVDRAAATAIPEELYRSGTL